MTDVCGRVDGDVSKVRKDPVVIDKASLVNSVCDSSGGRCFAVNDLPRISGID